MSPIPGSPATRSDMARTSPFSDAPEAAALNPSAHPLRSLAGVVRKAWDSWATRSLAMGGIATGLDVVVLLVCVHFGLPNPVAAMVGVTAGAIFTFFANRHFAFRDHKPELAPQAIKFTAATGGAMFIHAGLVYLLADRWGVPVVIAKLIADVGVFSVGQLFLLRYLVFPKHQDAPAQALPGLQDVERDVAAEPRPQP